jgi:hypothetical protein
MYDSFNTGSGILATFTTPGIISSSLQSASFTGSANIYPIQGGFYTMWMSVSCSLPNSSVNNLNINNFEFEISQSVAPVAPLAAQTALEPYITVPFVNSDYNAIINNATENRLSTEFMDVDYADSLNTPINLLALVSGSATPAQIQDSNYTTRGIISSRYVGKQLQSQKLNVYTAAGPFGPDLAPDKTPNVSNPSTYFLEFNWLAGLAPDYNGKIYASIKNLVDENGNRIKVKYDDEVSMGILKQTFGNGETNLDKSSLEISPSKSVIRLADPEAFGNNMASLNKLVYIDRVGQSPRPIIYSQVPSGSAYGYTSSISFIDGGEPDTITLNTVNDYTMTALAYGSPTTPEYYNFLEVNNGSITSGPMFGTPYEILFNAPIYLGQSASFATSSGASPTGSRYKPTGSLSNLSGSYVLNHRVTLDLGWDIDGVSYNGGERGEWIAFTYYVYLEKSTNNGSTWTPQSFKYNDQEQANLNTWDTQNGGWQSARTSPSPAGGSVPHYTFSPTKAGKTPHRYVRIYFAETQATTSSLYRLVVRALDEVYYFYDYAQDGEKIVLAQASGNGNVQGNGSAYLHANTTTWQVSQFPSPPGKGNVGYYWVTGSRPNIIHAQKGLNSYGSLRGLNDVYGQRQVDIKYNSNLYFLPIIEDFQLQVNDEIRFENIESQTYLITQISQSIVTTPVAGTYNAMTLVLDRDIPSTVNTNYFLIRRWVDDAYIILNTEKPAGQTSSGVLVPEYITDATEKVVDSIVPVANT